MPEITQEELDELEQLRQEKAASAKAAAAPETAAPAEPTHRAMLADGSTYDYAGGHPSHVTREGEDREIPVIATHPIA